MPELTEEELGKPLLQLEGFPDPKDHEYINQGKTSIHLNPDKYPMVKNGPKTPRDRHSKNKPRRRKVIPSSIDANNAAAMYALGIPKHKISQLLDLSRRATDKILTRPEVKEFAVKVREVIKLHSLASIQQVNEDIYSWLMNIAKEKNDPKAFDNLTRGIAALEKVASSASGENQRVNASIEHTVSGDLSEEAKALVKALFGPKEN